MTQEELLIHELAEKAGVTRRTIRYYIAEGLLPEPSSQGRYSYYARSYIDRLELIRRLKDAFLPLSEIREIMHSLTDDEVKRRLKELSLPSPKLSEQPKPPQHWAKPGARALEYIDNVIENQSKYGAKGSQERIKPMFREKRENWFLAPGSPPETFPASEETWKRVELTPGVELHMRARLDLATQNRVQQLINFAKRLFHINSQEG